MRKIFEGLLEWAMMVVTPAAVARRAAVILVDMPPVPKLEPADDTVQWQPFDLNIQVKMPYHPPLARLYLPPPQWALHLGLSSDYSYTDTQRPSSRTDNLR